jgi:demethylmenaquinone methyltransferase/2-methoxy-6-polyprenyl-1,4-benzoquinol methylase
MITHKEFFNSAAETWDTVCRHDTNKINFILDLLNIKTGARILDVGTGTGVLIPFLAQRTGKQGEITALDISEKMLEIAKRKYTYDNVSFICGDILDVNLPGEYFDYIICYSVFPHFNDKQSAIKIIYRYLKTGGKLIICHSQSRNKVNDLHKNASEAISKDHLPDIKTINNMCMNEKLKTVLEIDSEEMFVVISEK